MTPAVTGIHHITAIAGDPQRNLDFYAGILGLRLVKRTVNFDDPGTYHFYYGDAYGAPGTVLTFFPWGGSPRSGRVSRGIPGLGQATTISFSVPSGALPFWQSRLAALGVEVSRPVDRFGHRAVLLKDPDGISLALVAAEDDRPGYPTAQVPAEAAIRGFHSVLLTVEGYRQTADVLEGTLGFRAVARSDNHTRFAAGDGGPGTYVDVAALPTGRPGAMGVGAVHHVAFRVPDDEAHGEMRSSLVDSGMNVTPIMDREYFHSVYFREPGGVLFEIATDNPGFLRDEPLDSLGHTLKLPAWFEEQRGVLEQVLPAVRVPEPFPEERRV
ncbi:MAG: ring-cleaving dioxygenase [Spirochaetaceae bacterium]